MAIIPHCAHEQRQSSAGFCWAGFGEGRAFIFDFAGVPSKIDWSQIQGNSW